MKLCIRYNFCKGMDEFPDKKMRCQFFIYFFMWNGPKQACCGVKKKFRENVDFITTFDLYPNSFQAL